MGKIIAVASGKGGTGKTTTVAAVSSCLAALGFKTLCIDFDAGLRNLDLSLCMADFAVSDYSDVLDGHMDIMDACHEHPRIPNLYFLAAPAVRWSTGDDSKAVKRMFGDARDLFDFCLADSPSGIGDGFFLAHSSADMSIIVTGGELPAMRDAQRTAGIAHDMGIKEVRLLVNRVVPGNYRLLHTNIDEIIDSVGAQLVGLVREDAYVYISLHENVPLVLYKKRRSAYDFLDIARRLAGEYIPLRRRMGVYH
ncbi:MAG: AAA family ATPase [Oscillospiraceae bacterium]|nr:AAA family ATPase [Oscillospiraceae bacterium]